MTCSYFVVADWSL